MKEQKELPKEKTPLIVGESTIKTGNMTDNKTILDISNSNLVQ